MSVFGRVAVPLGDRAYDVIVGTGLLADTGTHLAPVLARPKVAIVTDETVAGLHLPALRRALDTAGIETTVSLIPPGEGSKDFPHLIRLLDDLVCQRVERTDTVVALGGGVVGDLAGLSASLLRRGVPVVQIPTTLLAQVDAAIGGKTGINTTLGKNLVGTFHQPRLVLCDIAVLQTLPEREFRAGYAEVVKYGLLGDVAFFSWLEDNGARVLAGEEAARGYAVLTSARAKAEIVAGDERESGRRALLNLGHTFGHALEAESGYGAALVHGEAVAAGLCLAFALSERLGLCPADDALRVRRHLAAAGLPTGLPGGRWEPERLLARMHQDKKVRGEALTFVLVRGIGRGFVSRDVSEDDVLHVLEGQIAA